jgi:RNA polymerase sigma-70 factor (ECF subfamily)
MSAERRSPHFDNTRWSVVVAAGAGQSRDAREALALLCEQYWYPLYGYLRRAGHSASDAEDLAQGFFLRLMEKGVLQVADPGRGRFRSFLLTALKHFVLNEWDRERAQKRGGATPPLSFDVSSGEHRFSLEPRDQTTPEMLYERQWADAVLERVMRRLQEDCRKAGKEQLFAQCQPYLQPDTNAPTYADLAPALGMSEGALKIAMHRLRKRFGVLLEDEISQTVASREDIQDEIRHLIAIVGRKPPPTP